MYLKNRGDIRIIPRFVEFGEDWNVLVYELSRRMACVMFVRVSRIEFAESDVSSDNFRQRHKAGRARERGGREDAIVFRFHRVLAGWLTRHLSPRTKPLEFEWNPAKVGRKWRFSVTYFFLPPRRGRKKKKEKKKKCESVEGRGFDLPPVATRLDRLQRGTVTLARRSQALTYLLTYHGGNHEKVTRAHSQPCYARKVKFTVDWQRDKEFAQ